MRDKLREDEIKHNTQIKAIADFLQNVFPQPSNKVSFKSEQHSDGENPRKRRLSFAPSPEDVYESLPSTSSFETHSKVEIQSDDNVDATEVSQEHVRTLSRENFGELASPYLAPYAYNKRFLDKQYDIRKEADGTFMIGNAPLSVDNDSNITIYGRHYNGTRGLWELLSERMLKIVVTTHDMKKYEYFTVDRRSFHSNPVATFRSRREVNLKTLFPSCFLRGENAL
jgi:hypothetical protein